MTDGQTATYTVTTSFVLQSNLTIALASSGYTSGEVVVPTSVVLPSGSPSVTFAVTTPVQVGYTEQDARVSVAAGTGYIAGPSSALTLVVMDSTIVSGLVYTGMWDFAGGSTASSIGGGSAMTLTGNVPFVNGSLSFSGNYPNDYAYASPPSTFNQLQFTIGVGFRIADLGSTHDIVVGGFGARWMMLDTDTVGNVSLVLNNHAVNIPLGFAITAGTDHALQVSIDTTTLTVITRFDGVKYTASIPARVRVEQRHPQRASLRGPGVHKR